MSSRSPTQWRSHAQKLQSLLNLAKIREKSSGLSSPPFDYNFPPTFRTSGSESFSSGTADKENALPSTISKPSSTSAPSAPGGPFTSLTGQLKKLQVEVVRQKERTEGFFWDLRNVRHHEDRDRQSAIQAREDLKVHKQESDTAMHTVQANLGNTTCQLNDTLTATKEAHADAEAQRQLVTAAQMELTVIKSEAVAMVDTVKKVSAQEVTDVVRMSEEHVARAALVERGSKLRLKKLGVITPATRGLVRELVVLGVPVKKVNRVIGALSRLTGVTVVGSIDNRSVRRIVLEGGIAAKMQRVEEISKTDGFTASGDGTTHKHINYEACNLYVNQGDTHTRCFLGISSAPNHTSKMQLHGLQKHVGELYDVYNASPHGHDNPTDARQFMNKLRGMNTDHTEDQKKLHRLTAELKTRNNQEVRGERALAELPTESMVLLVTDEMDRVVSSAGGADAWLCLPQAERAARYDSAILSVKMALGETAFRNLPAAEQRKVTLTGWLSLSACNNKKGHQDSYRWYFEDSPNVDKLAQFPNVSSVRFGAFGDAASEILVHLPVYIEFLEHARDKKVLMNHSHMEKNIYRALKDQPTLMELCALSLYSQAVPHPYLREVHGPDSSQINHLDLGPLHERVRAHCKAITEQPSRLLAPDASHMLGALDGKQWERPVAFAAVHQLRPLLPDIENITFCAEFNPNGLISTLNASERNEAWVHPTNDDNKGALGTYRHNAHKMYKLNQTADFVDTFTTEEHKFLRQAACNEDGSGLERKRRQEQIELEKEAVTAKRRKRIERAHKKGAMVEKLMGLTRITNPDTVTEALVNVALDLQLDWYRIFVDPLTENTAVKVPKKNTVGLKVLKIAALKDAIARYTLLAQDIRDRVEAKVQGDPDDEADSMGEAVFFRESDEET
ncbi:hypothetical protein LXA43DRAFT_1065838 [Ganoderma leucocontextum]|nr:hypothetical protein LXA43DRAFT_1065838 [Ganoderma leucocontextum]